MVFDAQKTRLLGQMSAPYDEDEKRALLQADREKMTKFQPLRGQPLAPTRVGYCIALTVIESFKGPRFDRGYP